jgi:thiol-disulfide isomerase/thioredoxin
MRMGFLAFLLLLASCASAPTVTHARSGATATLDSLQGKAVVMSFWADWCDPCLKQMPMLARISAEEGQDVLFVPVYYRERPPDGLASWLQEQPPYFAEAACWGNQSLLLKHLLTAIPRTYVYGRNGRVVEQFEGTITEDKAEVFRWSVRRALGAVPTPEPR